MAVMTSVGSDGEPIVGVSTGVGGWELMVDDVGVGRVGNAVGGAMGSVNDSRLVVREADDAERVDRVSTSSSGSKEAATGGGGGGMASELGTRPRPS